jgi:hypothetical protein
MKRFWISFPMLFANLIAMLIFGSILANAQVIVQYPDFSPSVDGDYYLNIEANPVVFSSQYSGRDVVLEGPAPGEGFYAGSAYSDHGSVIAPFSLGSEVVTFLSSNYAAIALSVGTVVGPADTSFAEGAVDFTTGTNEYGFEVNEQDGLHYGYLIASQSGYVNSYTGVSTVVDTIVAIAYDQTAGQSITVEDAPEPSSWATVLLSLSGVGYCARRKLAYGIHSSGLRNQTFL